MKLLQTRRKIVFGIAIFVLIVTAVYAIIQANDPYRGLNLTENVIITDLERSYVEQRIDVSISAISAQEDTQEGKADLDLYLALAWDYTLLGDLVNARETYERFFELNPIHYTARGNYATILKKMGDIEGAEEAYLEVLEMNPSEASYRNYVTLLQNYYDGERDDDVLKVLEAGVLTEGQTPWFMVALAEWYLDHDQCEEAIKHYEVLVSISPDNTAAVDDYESAKARCAE